MKVKKMFTVIALCLISVCSVFAQHRYDEDLLRACKYGYLRDVQKSLLKDKADPNAWQPNGSAKYTALGYACESGDINIVKMLVEAGANVNANPKEYKSPLMIAVEKGDLNIIDYLINTCNANPNICDIKGKTLLMTAVEVGKTDTVRLILKSNFGDIDSVDNKNRNALHYAVIATNFSIVKQLLNEGINLYQCDDDGYTPFMRAAINQNSEMVKFFLRNVSSFDVNRKDDNGFPPLLLCIKKGFSITMINAILRYGNEPTSVIDDDGNDIYYYLNRWGTEEMRDAVNEAKYY